MGSLGSDSKTQRIMWLETFGGALLAQSQWPKSNAVPGHSLFHDRGDDLQGPAGGRCVRPHRWLPTCLFIPPCTCSMYVCPRMFSFLSGLPHSFSSHSCMGRGLAQGAAVTATTAAGTESIRLFHVACCCLPSLSISGSVGTWSVRAACPPHPGNGVEVNIFCF